MIAMQACPQQFTAAIPAADPGTVPCNKATFHSGDRKTVPAFHPGGDRI